MREAYDDDKDEVDIPEGNEMEHIMAEEAARRNHLNQQDDDEAIPELDSAMKEILQDTGEPTESIPERFKPKEGRYTLHGALQGHESLDAAQADLIRLLCWLRQAPHGCDHDVVPQPWLTRRRVLDQPKKWQNLFRHQVAKAEALEKMPAQRKSRQSAWVEATEKAKVNTAPNLPSCMVINSGDIVAVHHEGVWKVGAVLTVWRFFKKGSGAQPVACEIPRGSLHSCRVVILEPDKEHADMFKADSSSACVVVPCDLVGMRLDTPTMKSKAGLEGMKLLLPEEWGCCCCLMLLDFEFHRSWRFWPFAGLFFYPFFIACTGVQKSPALLEGVSPQGLIAQSQREELAKGKEAIHQTDHWKHEENKKRICLVQARGPTSVAGSG